MKQLAFLAVATVGILLSTSCQQEDSMGELPGENGNASLTILIKGDSGVGTRASETPSAPTQAEENEVKNLSIYIFNYVSGVLEREETLTSLPSDNKHITTGLSTTSQKRVVVLVNKPADLAINSYSDLSNSAKTVSLDTQSTYDLSSSSTNGLFMSGEYGQAVTLNPTTTTEIQVSVKRLVAKVRLGKLTIPADATGFDLFSLSGVSVQKTRDKATVKQPSPAGSFGYVSGVTTTAFPSVKSYLNDVIALPNGFAGGEVADVANYFYVFPNDNTDDNYTLLTLAGSLDGGTTTTYYPFIINIDDPAYKIESNKIYTLNVTLKKLTSGSDDPNEPYAEGSLEVEITVDNWETELVQNVEW